MAIGAKILGNNSGQGSQNGTGDHFPAGQCTWWACDRYEQLTGYYTPFGGNAGQWAMNCQGYGWRISSVPLVPSIICLQPGVQLADPVFGHVGVVEQINADGSVTASNLNWGLTPAQRAQVSYVKFWPGSGVSFIYAVLPNGQPAGNGQQPPPNPGPGPGPGPGPTPGQGPKLPHPLAPDATIAAVFAAMDYALQITDPFNPPADQISLGFGPLSTTITDPFSWFNGVMVNLYYDATAIWLRGVFLLVGAFLLFKVSAAFIDYGAIAGAIGNIVKVGEAVAA